MSTQQQQFIQNLIETGEKLFLEDFFKKIHQKFYSDYDISFMEYFLELTTHEGEFVVHHEKLIEYGIVTSNRSFHVKEKLNALDLVEDIDYYHLPDVRQMVRPQGGGKKNNIYMITPEAFKKCLMRAQRRPAQKVDPVIYCDYYLLLEKTYKLYTDYEKQLLNRQLEHQAHQLEQKDQLIIQKDHQLEQQSKLDSFDFPIKIEISFQRSSHFKTYNVCSTATIYPNLNRDRRQTVSRRLF